ncbi:hypothetical protein DFH28DRAFT_310275 [Melampsora americana]|nr:hypothetical protein DFH28DRAFT_310275 [Melampsora americana]
MLLDHFPSVSKNIVKDLNSLHLVTGINPAQSSISGFKNTFNSIDSTSSKNLRASYEGPHLNPLDLSVSHHSQTSDKLQAPVMASSSRTDHKCWVIVKPQGRIKPFRELTNVQVIERVNQVLMHLEANINHDLIKVVDCLFSTTGCVKLLALSDVAAGWLRIHMGKWAPLVDPRLSFKESAYKVVVTNLPNLSEDSTTPGFSEKICESNQIELKDIRRIYYSKYSAGKSMMIFTCNPDLVARIEQEGLLIDGSRVYGHKYQSVIEECDNCLHVGHHYSQCVRPRLCGTCGGGHWSSHCKAVIPRRNHQFCHVCQRKYLGARSIGKGDENDQRFHHSRHSLMCPTKLKEIQKWQDRHMKQQQIGMMASTSDHGERHMKSSD